jgi:PhnB protein
MSQTAAHIPDGYHSVTPSITCKNAAESLLFYTAAFGAVETIRLTEPGSEKVMHAEMRIGNSTMMLSDEYPTWGALAPNPGQGGAFMIYVPDVEAAFARAIAAGATVIQPISDQFWGDRTGRVLCPNNYRWALAQKIRDVPPEEINRLAAEWQG